MEIKADNEIRMEWNRAVALLERLITKVMQKKMSLPVNERELLRNAGQPQGQTKVVMNPATAQPEQAAERPPQPKPSVLASKYSRLKKIDSGLKEQNKAIFECEKRRDKLKKELSECMGIFKSSRRKELQQEIDGIDIRISNMKKRLSSIVKEYKFDSVQEFYKEFNTAKREYPDYKAACINGDLNLDGNRTPECQRLYIHSRMPCRKIKSIIL